MPLDQINVDELDDREETENEMSFFDHIEALRGHLIRSVIAVFVASIAIFCFKDFVFNTVLMGPLRPDFITFRVLCGFSEAICFQPPQITQLVALDLSEQFVTHMTVSIWMGFSLVFPYIVWELWRFISPGLYEKEQSAAGGMVLVCGLLFIMGVLFGYYVVAPMAIVFLANYQLPGVITQPRLGSYIDSMVMFTIPLGVVFELPVVMYFLTKIGIVSSKMLRESRRYAVVILMIVSAIVTPSPDAASMFLVFVPLYSLYEISILVAIREERRQARVEKEEKDLVL